MSFISLPVVKWVKPTSVKEPPAGLLCVDSKTPTALGQDDVAAVQVLADVMALGFNRPRVSAPSNPGNLPHTPPPEGNSQKLPQPPVTVDKEDSQ